MEKFIKKADVLIEALPYIQKFQGKFVVVKYGGSAIDSEGIRLGVLEDLVFMSSVGMNPVLIHGGGLRISQRMREEGMKPRFIDGNRVTDKETIRIVKEVLLSLNRQIIREIKAVGGKAVGFSGQRNGLIQAERSQRHPELGFVGEVTSINRKLLVKAAREKAIPVVSPLGMGKDNNLYNVNADYVSARIACELRAEKLAILTNVKGIMRDETQADSLISTLSVRQVRELIKNKVIREGMIPKVEAVIVSLKGGVKKAHIIDARISHSLLLEIFTDRGIGTQIVRKS